jgi:putative protease
VTVVELTTAISNLRHLAESDLAPYDAIYLGNVYCRRYEANLLERPAELREAVARVRDGGRRAYVATYAAPEPEALPVVLRAVEAAAAAGVEAVEVHAPGLFKAVHEAFPQLPLHAGHFANVYTDLGVDVLTRYGVRRVAPAVELPLDEIAAMARSTGMALEVVLHGKVPLGLSDTCILLEHEPRWGARCPDLCQREVFLRREDWAMKSVGTGILSGRDVCLLARVGRLLAAGICHFRIEAVSESPAYRHDVGRVYRDALTRAMAGDAAPDPAALEVLARHAPLGFCDGFALGRSGMEYEGGCADAAAAARPA